MQGDIFSHSSYKAYINEISKRGDFAKMAKSLQVHTTLISHIFKGDKHLSLEQAALVCDFLGLSELETDYFMALVQRDKAGNSKYRNYTEKQISKIKQRSKKLSEIIPTKTKLSEEERATFYSHWFYSAIRTASSISELSNESSLQNYFKLPTKIFNQALNFLIKTGLCKRIGKEIHIGPSHTYLESDSILVSRHHSNWRLKVIEESTEVTDNDLMFTGPLSISESDADIIRGHIIKLIENTKKTVDETTPEKFYCLNIDFVEIKNKL